MEKRILVWEPCFFMFFGLFHLHRIWGLIDRNSYAAFWIGVLESRGVFYFILMGILAILCILGMITFWNKLLMWMFDVNSIYWNFVWMFFVLLGGFAFILGVRLMIQRNRTV